MTTIEHKSGTTYPYDMVYYIGMLYL